MVYRKGFYIENSFETAPCEMVLSGRNRVLEEEKRPTQYISINSRIPSYTALY